MRQACVLCRTVTIGEVAGEHAPHGRSCICEGDKVLCKVGIHPSKFSADVDVRQHLHVQVTIVVGVNFQ